MNANQAIYGVATMCRVLAVSASGYYAWRKRPPSARTRADVELTSRIIAIHQYSHGTYGAPRVHEELLVLTALNMALGQRCPGDVIHHSDRRAGLGSTTGELSAVLGIDCGRPFK